jgi:hypothetical protein
MYKLEVFLQEYLLANIYSTSTLCSSTSEKIEYSIKDSGYSVDEANSVKMASPSSMIDIF